MKLSVVICTRNRPGDVAACLPTVLACLHDDWEVILVDQSDGEGTRNVVHGLAPGRPALIYVPTETVGKSRALDVGIRRARGTVLAFTDDDCEAPPGWLDAILSEFEQSPDADVLFGPVLPSPAIPDVESVCVPAWSFSEARDLRPGEVCGMGANMALRRSVLDRLPPGDYFDSSLGPGAPFPAGEEGDFVYRLRRAGARAALRPSLRLYHRAFRTPDHWLTVLEGYGAGDAAFFGKHARCGDAWARQALAERLGRGLIRACAKSVLRRRPNNDAAYVRGFLRGLRQSLQTPIDAQTRLYLSKNQASDAGAVECGERAGTGVTKILFVMETGLGHVTVFKNLQAAAERVPGVEARFETITFDTPGLLGRIPKLRNDIVLRGGWQARQKVLRAVRADTPDVLFLHTQMVSVFLDDVMMRIPTAISLDATPRQFLKLGPYYGLSSDPNTSLERRRDRWYRRAFASCARLFPYTQWAADSLVQDYDVDPANIQIFAHGVDLEQWQPGPRQDAQPGDPLRLLFVGGDFIRKGGDLLLRWMRERAPAYCELDLVTGEDVPPTPRVSVHSGLTSNDPKLRALFAGADLFVLPTRADCTPQVIMEALASGLPVLTTDVAALPDMLGGTGALIPPDDYEALAAALERLDHARPTLRTMGRAARARAEAVYNGPRNLGEELDALRGLAR